MRLILRKIFNDRNYVLFLLISSAAMIFVVPVGSHVYRYLGPSMLLFFLAAKYFQGEMTATRLRNFRSDRSIFLFAVLLGLSCVSFVPQTFGTMLIFATLYLGVKKKVVINHHLVLVVQFVIMLILSAWTYMYLNWIPRYGVQINNIYLSVQFILFLFVCTRFDFIIGKLFVLGGAIFLAARTLFVSMVVYCFSQIPFIKNRLTIKPVVIFFLLSSFFLFVVGGRFEKRIVLVPSHPKYHTWKGYSYIKFHKVSLGRFSGDRIRLNNEFFREIANDWRRILFGNGLDYKGNITVKGSVTPVHNSFLDIVAQQGILFLLIYLSLLVDFLRKYASAKDFTAVISMITFGMAFNGIFNTFPLILMLSSLLVEPN